MLNVKLSKVEEEIEKERADTKHLCLDLEDPDNHDRWREVGEMIPDQELLNAKIAVLEQRLSNNKENLLEKELVIDDIVSLTERLKLRQNSAKSKMQPIIQKLNTLKVKVKDINRRIKAVVSELSMYQATAIRLEQEKAGKEKLLKTSKDLFEKGEPPNDDALISFERLQREYYAVLSAKSPNSSSMERNCYHVPNAIKRTVKSRPSAYIPDNDPIGLPKPVCILLCLYFLTLHATCILILIFPFRLNSTEQWHLSNLPKMDPQCDIFDHLKVKILKSRLLL